MKEGMVTCIGAISGTSMDAVDVAALRTDGEGRVERLAAAAYPYPAPLRDELLAAAARGRELLDDPLARLERGVTAAFAAAITQFMQRQGLAAAAVDLVGCHGQTVFHEPKLQVSRQLCDCLALAGELGMDVVGDFRRNDLRQGGEGAPLAPLYHAVLARGQEQPVAFLNLGGVGNVTYVDGERIWAFDTGPAGALLDDYMLERCGAPMDEDGRLAAAGEPDAQLVREFLADGYFARRPPKSLDRNHFRPWLQRLAGLEPADAAATLTAFTVASVAAGVGHLPSPPRRWLVCGGGRRNSHMLERLNEALDAPVEAIEAIGCDGDAVEAETFAYLACRSVRGLPLSLPQTTGAREPATGGQLFQAVGRAT